MIESKVNKDLEKQIDLYANGKLDADQIDELWAELIQDEYYLDYMKSVVNVKAVLDRNQNKQQTTKVFDLRKFTQYATTAAAVLIIAVAGILTFSDQNAVSVNPIDSIGLDVVRNAEGVPEDVTNEAIRTAIRLASEGEIQQAVTLLEAELNSTSDPQLIADIALTLGSIHYNAGDYESSIENFELITEQQDINILTLEKGYWYLGNAYFQMDKLAQAEESFQKAYNLNGAYSRVAKTYVDALNNIL